ncbi:hypothetical protein AAUPMC_01297 [Pasteurella multocida subsp. multocida str. Anand1_cattle]|nr:hypothetical protein AAUPMC_01297 [Pasteurella multocida subsp. multocida str. Anand1_cattle]
MIPSNKFWAFYPILDFHAKMFACFYEMKGKSMAKRGKIKLSGTILTGNKKRKSFGSVKAKLSAMPKH